MKREKDRGEEEENVEKGKRKDGRKGGRRKRGGRERRRQKRERKEGRRTERGHLDFRKPLVHTWGEQRFPLRRLQFSTPGSGQEDSDSVVPSHG